MSAGPAARSGPIAALFSPSWPPEASASGIATYVAHMREGMQACGVRPQIIVPHHAAPPFPEDVHRLADPQPEGGLGRLLARTKQRLAPDARFRPVARALLAEVRRLHASAAVELLEMEESFGFARFLAASPVPVVLRLHGPWFLVGPTRAVEERRGFERRVRNEGAAIRRAAAVSAPSRDILSRVIEHYAFEPRIARVIPNPVPAVPPERRWDWRNCERETLLFVGRCDACKGADTAIDAFAEVLRLRPSARLLLVGPETGLTGGDVRSYTARRLAERANAVEILGQLPPAEVAQLRMRAAVTIAPSRYEVFGYTAAEAMAAGCPLVAAGVGGQAEMLHDGLNALTCRPGNPEELARKILTLLDHPELAARLGAQAAVDIEQNYQPRHIAALTLDFYQSLLPRTHCNPIAAIAG